MILLSLMFYLNELCYGDIPSDQVSVSEFPVMREIYRFASGFVIFGLGFNKASAQGQLA